MFHMWRGILRRLKIIYKFPCIRKMHNWTLNCELRTVTSCDYNMTTITGYSWRCWCKIFSALFQSFHSPPPFSKSVKFTIFLAISSKNKNSNNIYDDIVNKWKIPKIFAVYLFIIKIKGIISKFENICKIINKIYFI